jgi:hypothetical protein
MFSNELWNKSGVSATYSIDQSIRFNPADSTYMQRTHGAGGNVDLFTVSFWFKRSILGGEVFMFGSGANTSNTCDISFNTSDQLIFWQYIGSMQTRLITTQVFRDTSAWYHVVVVYDSGNSISSERAKIYINGARVTAFGIETYPSQNQDGVVGSNVAIGFGRYISYGSSNSSQYFPGYLAEMHYVNGSALDPSSFAEYNSSNIWIPKEYSGSYGTGGFFVDGRDASDLGDDESGNGNDLTTSGLASDDQMADSPTNNHCTWNPLRPTGSTTMSDGNLTVTTSGATYKSILGTIGIPPNSGIFYYEGVVLSHTIQLMLGWGSSEMGVNQNNNPATPKYFAYADYLGKYYSSSGDGSVGDAFENNDVIGLWIDTDNTSNNLKFYRNGTLQSTHSFDFSDVDFIMPLTQHLNGCSVTGRFASNQWTQTPSGITTSNAINTKNIGS